jgi:uncharacterized protein YdaU (DUF1376 family)
MREQEGRRGSRHNREHSDMSIMHIAFYPSDWLAGTANMSASEKGVYITLISLIYQAAGPIKMEVDRLQRSCGCATKKQFRTILEYLIHDGKVTLLEGFLSNKRAEKEIKNVITRSAKARMAAGVKWNGKGSKIKERSDANAGVEHMPKGMLGECHLDLDLDLDLEVEVRTSTTQEKAAAAFQIFLETHPRPVDTRKGLEKFMEILASGVPAETLIQAAENYAESVVDFSEKAKVQQSDNFLDAGRGLWRDHVA